MNEPRADRPAMANYGVPSELDGVLPWSWAVERLVPNRNYWLTHVDRAGHPHSMPLWGVWDPEANSFWFATDGDSFRARNLRRNSAVVVSASDTVEVVSVEGTATLVTDGAEAAAAMWGAKYADEDTSAEEFSQFFLGGTVFRVDPTRAFGIIERADEFGPRATRWVWESAR